MNSDLQRGVYKRETQKKVEEPLPQYKRSTLDSKSHMPFP